MMEENNLLNDLIICLRDDIIKISKFNIVCSYNTLINEIITIVAIKTHVRRII